MKIIFTIGLFFLFLIIPNSGFAQSASELGLVLTGKSLSCGEIIDRGDDLYLHYGVRMMFENKGQEPGMIINPALAFGTGLKEARFFYRDNSQIPIKTFETDRAKLESFRSMTQYFAGPKPPENMTITLDPGKTISFEHWFFVELFLFQSSLPNWLKEIDLRKTDAEGRRLAREYFTKRGRCVEFEKLQLTYEFSFQSDDSDPDLLEKMSQRWRRFGRLPVGTNGTYTITSEKFK